MNLSTVLQFLPVVGPVVAALPQFRALFEEIVATFGEKDQAKLREAYALAIQDAADAHADLQALVAKHAAK